MFLYSRYRISGAVGFDLRDLVPNNSSEMFSSIKSHLFHCLATGLNTAKREEAEEDGRKN